jgi:hypothetical protein
MPSSTFLGGVVLVLCASCAAPRLSVSTAAARFSLEGDFAAAQGASLEASDTDALGLGDPETSVIPRVDADWAGTHLSLAGTFASFEGAGKVQGTLTIDGETISGGTPVDSRFDLGAYSGVITWDVLPVGPLELGLGVGLTLVALEIDVTAESTGVRVGTDESFPVPLFAGRVGFEGSRFNLGASVGAIDVAVSDGELTLTDVDVFGELALFGVGRRPLGWLVGGYRSFEVGAQYDDGDSRVDADLGVSGPYLGLRLSF